MDQEVRMNIIDQAKEKVRKELEALQHELRVILPDMIKKAVELGDLSENSDYKAALERQEMVNIKIGQLHKRLSELSMIKKELLPDDEIALGSEVTILDLDTDEEKTYRLVLSETTEPKEGLISVQSPMGRAFLGKEEGDEVIVQTPSGTKNLEILSFKTIHDFDD